MNMEAKAWEFEAMTINELTIALNKFQAEAHREGMEEAAKVADWWGGLDGDGIATDIREKIKKSKGDQS